MAEAGGAVLEIGDKFAFICFNRAGIHHEMPNVVDLPQGYVASTALPGKPDPHWREWIGTIRAEQLEEADLYVGSKMASKTPDILDAENQELQQRTLCLYWAVHLTGFVRAHNRPFNFTGTMRDTGLNVRSIGEMGSPKFVEGTPLLSSRIDVQRLNEAAELASNIRQLYEVKGYPRFKRVFNAFTSSINEGFADVRLHQFVRCVEGFILPEIGKTKKHFKQRSELFLGTEHTALLEELFDLRSQAEHLHDVLDFFPVSSRKTKYLLLFQRAFEAEAIARYCISRFVSKPDLWPYFQNDDTLREFWQLEPKVRGQLWGEPMAMQAISSQFESSHIADDVFDH